MLTIDDMETVRGYEAVVAKHPDGATKATLESYVPEMEEALGAELDIDWTGGDFDNTGVVVIEDDGTSHAYNDWLTGKFTELFDATPQSEGESAVIIPIEPMSLKARLKR